MPVFQLTRAMQFPPAELASPSGLLAVGGDLSPRRLLLAYRAGIFPWYAENEPILWWSPDPRCLLFPAELHVSRSMQKVLRQRRFSVTYDRAFPAVIKACSEPRRTQAQTWITAAMIEAYCRLHELGFAHSVEVWREGRLAGGLYGVSLGCCFFGESMFSRESNASKAALIDLTSRLGALGFRFLDCQLSSRHLQSMGARLVPRRTFLALLAEACRVPTLVGNWGERDEFQSDAPAGSC